jgi:ubiquinone/menaquinone biosynthesis C-methylase UbiE
VYARGRPYHHPRTLARIRAFVGGDPIALGVDVACGTGMSAIALADHADTVVGLDVSPEMLRAARPAPKVTYMLGNAETMPFTAATVDAVTCCSGIHWFDQERFFTELRRVLRPTGWVGLYDHYFVGEMVDVPAFKDWSKLAFKTYPLPERNMQVGDPRAETPAGFDKIATEFFGDDIEMTHEQLADYQVTISNFVAAAERGTTRSELRKWVLDTSAPLFEGATTRTLKFLGSITCLRPA